MKTYSDNTAFHPEASRLTDAEMNALFNSRPIPCVDILVINKKTQQVYLPTRSAKSASGLWFIGGMLTRDLEPQDAAVKILLRETGLTIDSSRLSLLAVNRFVWDKGGNNDIDKGRVDINFCFTLDASQDEIDFMTSDLDESEYDRRTGFTAFTRPELENAIKHESPAKQVLLDYYDLVFSEN